MSMQRVCDNCGMNIVQDVTGFVSVSDLDTMGMRDYCGVDLSDAMTCASQAVAARLIEYTTFQRGMQPSERLRTLEIRIQMHFPNVRSQDV